MNSLLLQNREWLFQPEALQSMATSLRGLSEHAEKLVGFTAHSSAVAVAMRYLQPVADYHPRKEN